MLLDLGRMTPDAAAALFGLSGVIFFAYLVEVGRWSQDRRRTERNLKNEFGILAWTLILALVGFGLLFVQLLGVINTEQGINGSGVPWVWFHALAVNAVTLIFTVGWALRR